jgi:hypothetical protein
VMREGRCLLPAALLKLRQYRRVGLDERAEAPCHSQRA